MSREALQTGSVVGARWPRHGRLASPRERVCSGDEVIPSAGEVRR